MAIIGSITPIAISITEGLSTAAAWAPAREPMATGIPTLVASFVSRYPLFLNITEETAN